MYKRLCKPLLSNSFFLFGGRGTGKSSLLKELFKSDPPSLWLDLLDEETARRYMLNPGLLEEQTAHGFNARSWVVIDEVQRVPPLLNIVHRLIEKKKIKFALTGSSARKLKRGGANLLAGRAFLNHLHPLTSLEMGEDFNLLSALRWGTLPQLSQYDSDLERSEYLKAYVNTYLREEIKEEQLVRRIEPFLRFLEVAAQSNGQLINHSKIARDAGASDAKAVERYFEILVDTLIGFHLEPYHASIRKRQTAKAKFYFFDPGVKRALEGQLSIPIQPRTPPFGHAFEHFLMLEIHRYRDYFRREEKFSYLRTKDDVEVDLIIERPRQKKIVIEIKSSDRVDEVEILRLKALKKDLAPCDFWVASREKHPRMIEGFEILPWQQVLRNLHG